METYPVRGKLFYKFLFVLLLVSLGPLVIVGYYTLTQSKDIVKEALLNDQRALASGLTDMVYSYVATFRDVLVNATRQSEFQSQNLAGKQAVMNRLMQIHAALLELAVADEAGHEVLRVARFAEMSTTPLRDFSKEPFFAAAMRGGDYMGSLSRFKGQYPEMIVAAQLYNGYTGRPAGVLMAKLSLNAISSILKTGFPENSKSQAAIIAPDGFLVAHSDMETAFKPGAQLAPEVANVLLHNSEREGGMELTLAGGERVLCSYAEVRSLGWLVYLQQPASVADKTSSALVFKSARALAVLVGVVLFLGYLVSYFIVLPIQQLRRAAAMLGEGKFEDLPEIKMPNDEIGDLGRAFGQMSDSLRIKTAELMSAKEEMEQLNSSLETRVEARTRELKAALDELIKKERLAAIGQMASVVGHEIRNPLAVINNSTYFIKTKLGAASGLDPKVAKHIGIIESEIQQANGIINEILGFARTRDLMLKPVALNSYMSDLLESYPFPAHVEVVRNFAPQDLWVNIDAEEIKQAVRNIIGNGVEVMPQQGRLAVSTSAENGMAVIAISDMGPGIPQDVLEKIFAPFFTTKARGTGLGLAVVRKAADRHKGQVEVESEPGRGTTFRLYLPLCARPQ
ncbi:MAG: ATP-binding protein [Elusimicrobiales bacterium]